MNGLGDELFLGIGDTSHALRVVVRLSVALVLGGAVGLEREQEGKRAGVRTHMLVALGSALFTLVAIETRMTTADISRVMQGVAAGIGFLGAGTILKLSEQHEVKGLTTAASIWLTAAVGLAVGAGLLWPSVVSVALAWFVLFGLHRVEHWFKHRADTDADASGR
jgi:putative Mg2+ transporter-C (MgtC) family protein